MHSLYDVLKDFQPFVAAMIALAAATLAYRGAMAKVAFDRESRDSERISRQLGLLLRLRAKAHRLQSGFTIIADRSESLLTEGKNPLYSIVQTMPKTAADEFEEAWENLTLLPYKAFAHLEHAREVFRFSTVIAEVQFDSEPIKLDQARQLVANFRIIAASCKELLAEIDPRIKELDPAASFPASERPLTQEFAAPT